MAIFLYISSIVAYNSKWTVWNFLARQSRIERAGQFYSRLTYGVDLNQVRLISSPVRQPGWQFRFMSAVYCTSREPFRLNVRYFFFLSFSMLLLFYCGLSPFSPHFLLVLFACKSTVVTAVMDGGGSRDVQGQLVEEPPSFMTVSTGRGSWIRPPMNFPLALLECWACPPIFYFFLLLLFLDCLDLPSKSNGNKGENKGIFFFILFTRENVSLAQRDLHEHIRNGRPSQRLPRPDGGRGSMAFFQWPTCLINWILCKRYCNQRKRQNLFIPFLDMACDITGCLDNFIIL